MQRVKPHPTCSEQTRGFITTIDTDSATGLVLGRRGIDHGLPYRRYRVPNDTTVSTIILIDSADVAGSIGREGFLSDHLKPMGDLDLKIHVERVPPVRCDIVAQRLAVADGDQIELPIGIEDWYATMTDPLEIPDTTSLMILSLSEAVTALVRRHTETGILVQPPPSYREIWTDDQVAWLDHDFDDAPPTTETVAQALESISQAIESSQADLMVLNTSTFIPGEKVYWFREGEPETTSVRSARINLVVDTLLKKLDVALVDVDRIAAELGAEQAVTGPGTYSGETLDVVADEAISMILDLEGISRLFSSDAMQLSVPRYDRRTTMATLTRWHVAAGSEVVRGDALFDLRFGNLHAILKNDGTRTDKAIDLSVVAGRTGHVESISVTEGTELPVGMRVAIITSTPNAPWADIDNAARFPVGVKVKARDDG